MKYTELSFRDLCGHFAVLPIVNYRQTVADFPGCETTACILTYGYIDHTAGLTLEVLACGRKLPDGTYEFAETNDSFSAKIRCASLDDTDIEIIDYPAGRYSQKIEALSVYKPEEDVLKTREMTFLDGCRNEYCPDDVLVYLVKDGLRPEGCWARIEGLVDRNLVGTLLTEPGQDFGWHAGELISFFAQETEDKEVICVCDMNPDRKLTKADLADGRMLKEAIQSFNSGPTENDLIEVLQLLRDCDVWIPYTVVFSEADQESWGKLFEAYSDDPEGLIGQTVTAADQIRMIPDILMNGGDYFFQVFSSTEEMGEYGNHFSKVGYSFLKTITLARNNEKKVKGIVVNPFTGPFVLEEDLFDLVEKAKSRLADEETDMTDHSSDLS
ncbi:MAG: SseB family protein [Solobacterium sp.]|nr:SseB family protein [Solobacterium sp.]